MEASPTTRESGGIGASAGSRMLLIQPDAVLCKLAARGNANAYDALYQRYRQPIFAYVFHLLGRRNGGEDAEDITQEAFTKAFSAIGRKRSDGSFKHWIYTIARNLTFDEIRGVSHSVLPIDAQTVELKSVGAAQSASAHAESRAEFAWLVAAMGELPERQREALVMREMGGMSHTEIAEALDATVPATKKLISRGRATVGEAAQASGFRSRKLGKELAMAAPVLPIAAAGIGVGAATGATVGTAAVGTKIAATVLAVVAVGGSAAVVKSTSTHSAEAAAPQAQTEQGSGSASADAPASNTLTVDDRSQGGSGHRSSGKHGSGEDGRGNNNQSGSDHSGDRPSGVNHGGDNGGRDGSGDSGEHSGKGKGGSGSGRDDSADNQTESETHSGSSGKQEAPEPSDDSGGQSGSSDGSSSGSDSGPETGSGGGSGSGDGSGTQLPTH